jgi:hypothetical protein
MAQMQGSTGGASSGKCAHPACKCNAAPGRRFCSDYCERQGASGSASGGGCGCGHPACKQN